MNNKYNVGETVYIARNGFVLKTTIEAVMTDHEGNNASYSYAGRVFKDGTAAPYEWESTVSVTFKEASKLAKKQRA